MVRVRVRLSSDYARATPDASVRLVVKAVEGAVRPATFKLGLAMGNRKLLMSERETRRVVGAERIQVGRLDRDARFEANVRGRAAIREETPASGFEQLVDLDAGCGFLIGH